MLTLETALQKAPGSRDRSVPIEQTAERLSLLREQFGITRVGETTRLDRTGIPNYCAIVPNSPDVLGVYNGKGRTPLAARVSAVMEAFERQAAATVVLESEKLAVCNLDRRLNLQALDLLPGAEDLIVDCVPGTDLLSGETVRVPLALVRFPWSGAKVVKKSSTNGLASGNNMCEAIYHALTEMIERHVWSLYQVRCELVPRFYRGDSGHARALAPSLIFPTRDSYLDSLHSTILSAGCYVQVVILREGTFPTVALATVVEPQSSPPMAHIGLGCSLSPAHAVERALTEAVQSRVVDVQAAREDILRADDSSGITTHAKRLAALPERCWFLDLPTQAVHLQELTDGSSDDLAADVRAVIRSVSENGVGRAVAVDISPSDLPFAVVRIVGPEFETTAVDGRIGPIAREEFNPFATRLIS